MGIKFHCPNGHKLNVKSFLAGKKGVCPKCGTKFRIPPESEPGMRDSEVEETDAGHVEEPKGGNGAPVGTDVVTAAAIVGQSAAKPAGETAPPSPSAVAHPTGPAKPPAPPAEGAAASDPIAEAPTAIWYVRPPTGGQYGPAKGEVMKKWLSEGRVSSDSLVWREGWTDWRTAGGLFSNLQSVSGPAANPVADVGVSPRTSRTTTEYRAKQRGGNGLAIGALIVLAIVCVVLVGVLAYVLANLK